MSIAADHTTDDWVRWRLRNGFEDIGKFGEAFWKNVMADCNLFYVALADLPIVNGQGPRLQNSGVVLPDFEVSGIRRAYVDSKCKSGPVLYRVANSLRHGIDRKYYESYSAMSGINRQKCALAILELFVEHESNEWSGAMLMQTLGNLGEPVGGFSTQSHIVYWPRRMFVECGRVGPLHCWNIAKGTDEISDEARVAVREFFGQREAPIQGRMF